jgi:hypothetical protein
LEVGQGQLVLTNRRLIWAPQTAPPVSFPMEQLNSVYAMMDFGLAVLVGMRLYSLLLESEQVLQWVTFIGLVAREVEARTGHRITTSNF